ncbi:MAG: glucose-6-phosphate isomerase [Erysipelotrichaceae bacterium]|nr:glucose-6-phosphate isomerase [Erysipelotrichaceae bacterium]
MIKLDLSYAKLDEDLDAYQDKVSEAHKWLHEKTGKGSDYVGWVEWPYDYDKEEFDRIIALSEKLKGKYDVLLVCGIGGSYLGARAALEMIRGLFPADGPEVIFIGNTFSHTYISQVLKHIEDKEVILNVISKSGTTTETALAFRIFKQYIEKRYGKEEARWRIIATTDKNKGTLKELSDKEGYEEFAVPDDIGGRYSVFTAVGLLPLALAGVDIRELMEGAREAHEAYKSDSLKENDAYKYAVARRILNNSGYKSEMFVTYHLQLTMIAEWWKQLFGESEGKDGNGLLPTSVCYSTDLHSLGQFVQDGNKCLFETLFLIENMPLDIVFPDDKENLDGMNYLSGKNISWVNEMAMKGTLSAHTEEGNVPNILITLKDNSPRAFGYMIYFFFKACGMSCYLVGVNPFNQPGVEVYKKKMFKLLGKE